MDRTRRNGGALEQTDRTSLRKKVPAMTCVTEVFYTTVLAGYAVFTQSCDVLSSPQVLKVLPPPDFGGSGRRTMGA